MLRRNLIHVHKLENCGLRDGLGTKEHHAAKQRRVPVIDGKDKIVETEAALEHKDLIGGVGRK